MGTSTKSMMVASTLVLSSVEGKGVRSRLQTV